MQIKNGEHPGYDDAQFSISARQKERPELEEKIWSLFGELEAGPDEKAQAAVREKIWQLVVSGSKQHEDTR